MPDFGMMGIINPDPRDVILVFQHFVFVDVQAMGLFIWVALPVAGYGSEMISSSGSRRLRS